MSCFSKKAEIKVGKNAFHMLCTNTDMNENDMID